jgi:hypothetical protein
MTRSDRVIVENVRVSDRRHTARPGRAHVPVGLRLTDVQPATRFTKRPATLVSRTQLEPLPPYAAGIEPVKVHPCKARNRGIWPVSAGCRDNTS